MSFLDSAEEDGDHAFTDNEFYEKLGEKLNPNERFKKCKTQISGDFEERESSEEEKFSEHNLTESEENEKQSNLEQSLITWVFVF
jgi:hypothetical protein